jgi:hypothetical protein
MLLTGHFWMFMALTSSEQIETDGQPAARDDAMSHSVSTVAFRGLASS